MTGLGRLLKPTSRHSLEWRIGIGVALVVMAVLSNLAFAHAQKRWRVGYDPAETPSMPARSYLISMRPVTPERGDVVAFRTRGIKLFVDDSIFTKLVVGVPGDRIVVDEAGATVDGKRFPFTARALRRLNTSGMALARQYTLGPGEYFMAGTSPSSYDSRYYGPVLADQFMGPARPLW